MLWLSRSTALPALCALTTLAAVSCGQAGQEPNVSYGSARTVGRWLPEAAPDVVQTTPAEPTAPPVSVQGPPPSTLGPAAPAGSAAPPPPAAGSGTASVPPTLGAAGRPATSSAAGAPATLPPAAGSGGAASPSAAAISGVTFDVTTAPVGGRYQPRNIGAIWVQDASGKFVKSLEVWAGIRARYLTKYSSARAGQAVDVTASATLSSHRAHHASWTMKDRSGAAAAPGKYTLFIELTDGDMTGKFVSVDFDTSLGPQTLMPMDTANFKTMTLELK